MIVPHCLEDGGIETVCYTQEIYGDPETWVASNKPIVNDEHPNYLTRPMMMRTMGTEYGEWGAGYGVCRCGMGT